MHKFVLQVNATQTLQIIFMHLNLNHPMKFCSKFEEATFIWDRHLRLLLQLLTVIVFFTQRWWNHSKKIMEWIFIFQLPFGNLLKSIQSGNFIFSLHQHKIGQALYFGMCRYDFASTESNSSDTFNLTLKRQLHNVCEGYKCVFIPLLL